MGGTVDPKTGEVVWDMHVPLDEQLAFYRSHPPSLLGGLTVTPTELPGFRFDGHGEPVNAIFEVACPCGSRELYLCAQLVDDDVPLPPVELWCELCEHSQLLFDVHVHGYNGAMGNVPGVAPEAELMALDYADFVPTYEVIVRFEFPSDCLGDASYAGREPELFSWISIVGRAPSGELQLLFEYECA